MDKYAGIEREVPCFRNSEAVDIMFALHFSYRCDFVIPQGLTFESTNSLSEATENGAVTVQ